MTGTEIAFLAMGLILGIAAGAALIATLRSRAPSTREVRITVAPDAVPRRRAATLANDAFTDSPAAVDPARFGPADRDAFPGQAAAVSARDRTPVLDPRPGTVVEPAFHLVDPSANGNGAAPGAPNRLVVAQAMPVSTGIDPMLTALRASAAASAQAALASSSVRFHIRANCGRSTQPGSPAINSFNASAAEGFSSDRRLASRSGRRRPRAGGQGSRTVPPPIVRCADWSRRMNRSP